MNPQRGVNSCPSDRRDGPARATARTATLYVCRRRPSAVNSGHCGRAAGLADGRISSSTPAASSPMRPALARPRGRRRSGHIGAANGQNERGEGRVCSARRADGDKYKPLDLARLLSEGPVRSLRRRPSPAVRSWAHGDRRRRTAREHRATSTTAARRSRQAAARPRRPRPGRLARVSSTGHVASGRPRQSQTAEPTSTSCATERAGGASGTSLTESGARSAGRRGAAAARAAGRARRRAADNRRPLGLCSAALSRSSRRRD
jgi:hypothetical protein